MAHLERLDSRTLLTAALTSGTLALTGTDVADTFTLTVSGSDVRVQQSAVADRYFPLAQVLRVTADLKGGNDRLSIADAIAKATTVQGGSGNDTVRGGGGKDSLAGGDGADSLDGGLGDDVVKGGGANDTLLGNAGVDALFGEAGDDSLDGGMGNDYLDGGSGNDAVSYAARTAAVRANLSLSPNTDGTKLSVGGGGGQTGEADRFNECETLLGGSAADELWLDDWSDNFYGRRVTIDGRGGNDKLSTYGWAYSGADASLYGGSGDDKFVYDVSTPHHLYGGGDNDEFENLGDEATLVPIDGGAGYDTVRHYPAYGFPSDVTMGPGVERLYTGNEIDVVRGNDLANEIYVTYSREAVTVYGGGGNDRINVAGDAYGEVGTRAVYGDGGNDTITGSAQRDSLYGGENNDSIDGGGGDDVVRGGNGNDSLRGGSGRDGLFGEAGLDTLDGGSGADYLDGGADDDILYAKDGTVDTLQGGTGYDRAQRDTGSIADSVLGVEAFLP